jgi:hypothetical protein
MAALLPHHTAAAIGPGPCHSLALGEVSVPLGRRTIAVPWQRHDDHLAGAHDGVAVSGGVASDSRRSAGVISSRLRDLYHHGFISHCPCPANRPSQPHAKTDAAGMAKAELVENLAEKKKMARHHAEPMHLPTDARASPPSPCPTRLRRARRRASSRAPAPWRARGGGWPRGGRRKLAQLTAAFVRPIVRPPWGRLRLVLGTDSLRTCQRLPAASGRCRTARRGAGDAPWGRGSQTKKPPSFDLGAPMQGVARLHCSQVPVR